MKISLRIFRLSKKMVLIVAGVLVLGGAAGATAVYIGKDKLLGPPAEVVNGGECTDVKIMKIHKKSRYWLRKYVEMEASDGLTRLKTALRVAEVLYTKEQPDLVQVVVLDKNGPKTRADMSGHAIGAEVIYVPEPEKLAELVDVPVLQASYIDSKPNESGDFYGQKIVVPADEARQITASIEDKVDCIDPTIIEGVKTGEGAKAEGEAAKPEGESAKPEGEAAPAEGEAPKAEGEAPKAEGEAAPAEGEKPAAEGEKPKEDKGWFGSIKAMVFGEETASAETPKAEGEAPKAEGEAAKPEGEVAPASEAAPENPAEAAPAAEEQTAAPEGEAASPEGEVAAPEGEAAPAAEPFAPGGLPDATPAPGHKKPLLPADGEGEGKAEPAAHSG